MTQKPTSLTTGVPWRPSGEAQMKPRLKAGVEFLGLT